MCLIMHPKYFNCEVCDCSDCPITDCNFVNKAVRKQIPKKPIKHMANPVGFPYYECPVCGDYDVSGQKYCDECGQKLDWGEQNEQIN